MAEITFGHKTYKYDTISNLFNKIYHSNNLLESKLDLGQAESDAAKALELELYFRRIKQAIQSEQLNATQDKFLQEIAIGLGPGWLQMFNYNDMTNRASGIAFEQELTKIINAAMSQSLVDGGNNKAQEIGQFTASTGNVFTEEQVLKHFMGDVNKMNQYITRSFEEIIDNSGNRLFRLKGKEGKIDISVPESFLSFKQEISGDLKRFVELLNGATFSAKNYVLSQGGEISNIRLGSTSGIRMYSSVFSFLNPEASDDEIFNLYIKTRSSRAYDHKKHLRFIYELIGPGLIYNEENIRYNNTVQYLIVNARDGSGIRVLSTKQLIKQHLESAGRGKTSKSTGLTISYNIKE